MWRFTLAIVLALATGLAQDKPPGKESKEDEEAAKLLIDPYTGADPALMKAAGVVAYGPFPWADFHRTEDIDRVIGEKRVIWVETTHFRIGLGLKSAAWPEGAAAKKALQDELKELRKILPKVPEKPRRLDSWLRLHLYIQRCERAYSEFQKLIGVTDADFPAKGKMPPQGAYLGLPDKFLVLLVQKRSDMARYMDRFCNRKDDTSLRFYHDKTYQMLVCVASESLESFDEAGVHGHVLYAVWQNLMNGYNGFSYPLPLWFSEGLAHWHARKVPSEMMNIQVRDDEAVDEMKANNWAAKVRARAQHNGTWFPFETMAEWSKWEDLGYHAHSQSWSRLDYLMQLDRDKVGLMLRKLKSVPSEGSWDEMAPRLRALAKRLVFELFEFDGPAFDEKWREWVLKTYPKK